MKNFIKIIKNIQILSIENQIILFMINDMLKKNEEISKYLSNQTLLGVMQQYQNRLKNLILCFVQLKKNTLMLIQDDLIYYL